MLSRLFRSGHPLPVPGLCELFHHCRDGWIVSVDCRLDLVHLHLIESVVLSRL